MHRPPLALALLLCAAPAYPCDVPGNDLNNCGFAVDVTTNWTNPVGTCSHDGAVGSSAVGSASCTSSFNGVQHQVTLRQCTPDAVDDTYGFGADGRLDGGTPICNVNVQSFTDDGCTAPTGNSDSSTLTPGVGVFAQSALADFATGFGTSSLQIEVVCAGTPNPFTIHLDDFFAGVGLTPVTVERFTVE
jgi:hypothetical protein